MALHSGMACVLVLATVGACSPAEKTSASATEVTVAPTKEGPAGVDRFGGRESENEAGESITAKLSRPGAGRLCRAFDRAAIAKAMGWRELERLASVGSSFSRGIWSCMFMAKDHPDGAGFGVTFMTTLPFMEYHIDAPYMRREPIAGHDAVVAKHANGKFVSIQVHARGITIETNANDGGPPDEVEDRLADATAKLLATLSIDPASALK